MFWVATAALASLFWAIHPLTTQAVTYIVQRYESLSAMGYLGVWVGLLVVLVAARSIDRMSGYAMILAFAWIGLMSKEVFATAPLSLLLFDRQLTRQSFATILRRRWPAYLLMVSPFTWFVLSVSRWFDTTRESSMGLGMEAINSWEYLRTQPEVILHYLKLAIWPHPLSIDYVWRIQQRPEIYLSLGVVIVFAIALAACLYFRGIKVGTTLTDEQPAPATKPAGAKSTSTDARVWMGLFGWGMLSFFFILAPTSSIMPIADIAVEHRMYLPLVLVVVACVFGSAFAVRRLWAESANRQVLATGIGCIVIALGGSLAWRTHVRNLEYRDELTIWMGVTEVVPENPRGWYHAGSALYKRGHRDAALPYMVSAVGFGGTNVPMYDVGLADCLRHAGRVDEALFFYRRAIENKPGFAEAHNNLGVVYLNRDDDEMASRHFSIAAELDHVEAMHNLAMIHERHGQFEQAIIWLEKAMETAKDTNRLDLTDRFRRRLQSNQKALSLRTREGVAP